MWTFELPPEKITVQALQDAGQVGAGVRDAGVKGK